ncbi:MAG: ATP-dependent RNA helicase HrpA [Gammaproteobacteria bacterium]|nr:ATP-dependent RNA helicase HrpA [Gammaproteobacteria bacterium]
MTDGTTEKPRTPSVQARLIHVRKTLGQTMLADRVGMRQLIGRIENRLKTGKSANDDLERLEHLLGNSLQKANNRAKSIPLLSFPEELPVSERRDEIAAAIQKHQVVVICGETGSGKTTQIPKICMQLGRGVTGIIGHTQPRRIAARTVAARIAEELKTPPGQLVGYKVRFTDSSSEHSLVKLMTDGILLAELQRDRMLWAYDTIIIDEAHERSLNIDFLLGYLKQLLPRRPELKLIITSATIDPDKFSVHFNNAPVIEVSGRTYPVDLDYREPRSDDGKDLIQQVVDAVEELPRDHTLVFLSGEREIHEVAELLRRKQWPNTLILPLYARLSVSEQQRAFRSDGPRRIVLATNVAETSITVPGIRFVVDAGYARISRYSHRSKVQRLPIEKISQAAASQRAGRCGRVRAGICVRLYSQEDFEARAAFTDPEILRTNLASVILQMAALGLGDIDNFPFLEPPDPRFVRDGYRLLRELGAVDENQVITPMGRQIARFPVDPVFGRMILAADKLNCLREVLVIASGLSIQDPRERPGDARDAADQRHAEYAHKDSDFMSFVALWDLWQSKGKELSGNQLRKWSKGQFLNFLRMREWQDVYQQLRNLARELKLEMNSSAGEYPAVHKALLSGLVGHVGELDEKREYRGVRGARFAIFPGSSLSKKNPRWVMAAALVETSRLWARVAARIEPLWVEEMAGHLVHREYGEPTWGARVGRVTASETVSLFGLILVAGRQCDYGRISPVEARRVFIRDALVADDYPQEHHFLERNRVLLKELEDIEARQRTRGVWLDSDTVFEFYDAQLPAHIHDRHGFEKYLKRMLREDAQWLCMQRGDLVEEARTEFDEALFPPVLQVAGTDLKLSYQVTPGSQLDGVSINVPLPMLPQMSLQKLNWLVPGMLEDKVTAMIKSLPKVLRKNFVPVPDFARAVCCALKFGEGALEQEVARQLQRMTGVSIPGVAWDADALPSHLRMGIRVMDENGKELAHGLDPESLGDKLGKHLKSVALEATVSGSWARRGLQSWDFDDIPEWLEVSHGGTTLRAYPALQASGDRVDQVLAETPDKAGQLTRQALLTLLLIELSSNIRYMHKVFLAFRDANLVYQRMQADTALVDDFILLALEHVFLEEEGALPRGHAAYQALLDRGKGIFVARASELANTISRVLLDYQAVRMALVAAGDNPSTRDVEEQLAQLVFPGFLRRVTPERLVQYPRYLKAAARRVEKLGQGVARDQQRALELVPLVEQMGRLRASLGDRRVEQARWMLEEFRVSLFAQELGTPGPVSAKRIRKMMEEIAGT